MSMIEKVARAIYEERLVRPYTFDELKYRGASTAETLPQERGAGVVYELLLKEARAAIEAMREPTSGMKTGDDVHWDAACHICGGHQEAWHNLIDAALTEQNLDGCSSPCRVGG